MSQIVMPPGICFALGIVRHHSLLSTRMSPSYSAVAMLRAIGGPGTDLVW